MWGNLKTTKRSKRKARKYEFIDETSLEVDDPSPFEKFKDYPIGRRAIVTLPRPFKIHRQRLKQSNILKKTHQDSERFVFQKNEKDSRLPATPDAILGIHILELTNVSLRVTNFDRGAPMFFYCVIYLGNQRRMTKISLSANQMRVRIDSTVFFTIEVSNIRENYRNRLKLEIWAFQDPNVHYIIGSKDIHLYTIILEVHSIEYVEIWSDGLHAGTIIYEFAYAYGAFGYGHSNQLRNTKSSVFEQVIHSMFPRIRLTDEEIVDNRFNVRIPKKVHMLGMSNFLLYPGEDTKKQKERPSDDDNLEPKFFRLHQVEFDRGYPVFAKVNLRIYQEELEADFNEAYGEFICISNRRDRIEYLRTVSLGRLEDIYETESGALFQELKDEIAEHIIRTEEDPFYMIYPKTRMCTTYTPVVVEPDDEELYTRLPALSRTTGYIGRLFGISPLETDPHFGEPDYQFNYLRKYKLHKVTTKQHCIHGLKYIWSIMTTFVWRALHILLPELRTEKEIPEIAVTLASPQGSTTNLYVSWVSDEYEQALHGIRRNKDPTTVAYDTINKLLYDEYDKEVHIDVPTSHVPPVHQEPKVEKEEENKEVRSALENAVKELHGTSDGKEKKKKKEKEL